MHKFVSMFSHLWGASFYISKLLSKQQEQGGRKLCKTVGTGEYEEVSIIIISLGLAAGVGFAC